jgi:hypothetical protein
MLGLFAILCSNFVGLSETSPRYIWVVGDSLSGVYAQVTEMFKTSLAPSCWLLAAGAYARGSGKGYLAYSADAVTHNSTDFLRIADS